MQNTRIYELMIVFKLNVAHSQIKNIVEEFVEKNYISEIINIEYLGLRSIPLQKRKSERAHFVCIHYHNTAENQMTFISKLKLREDVIRFMAVRQNKMRSSPSHLHKSDYPMYKYSYSEDINPQEIYYHNIDYLRKFTTERGKILSARMNHLSSRDQKKIAREIKRARSSGLIAFMNE